MNSPITHDDGEVIYGSECTIDGYRLVCTSSVSPEQYDVFLGDREVGYLRLRHNMFWVYREWNKSGVSPEETWGKFLYEAPTAGYGSFEPSERQMHLETAIKAIHRDLQKDAGGNGILDIPAPGGNGIIDVAAPLPRWTDVTPPGSRLKTMQRESTEEEKLEHSIKGPIDWSKVK